MSFWKDVFSASNNQSWGRVAAAIALIFGIAWITRLVMLINGPEQYEKLGNVAIFIGAVTGLVSALYGISKGLDVIKEVKGSGNDQNPPAA